MYSDTKTTRSVADAVSKIMNPQPVEEELKGGQVKLDKNHNGKIDGQDFKILKGQKKANEEVELEEDVSKMSTDKLKQHWNKHKDQSGASPVFAAQLRKVGKELAKRKALRNEEVEQMDEVKMADLPSTKVQGRSYGSSKPEPHAVDTLRGPKEKELKDIEVEKKKKKFSEMVNLYQEKGLKALSEMLVKEEPDNEQFTKELEDAKAKSEGKKPNKEIAKGKVDAVKSEEVQTEEEVIEEREMTSAEMEKREDIVKSMKKGMAGFKERYGDKAKNVMYATATKQAMK